MPIVGTVASGTPDGRCDAGPARKFLIGVADAAASIIRSALPRHEAAPADHVCRCEEFRLVSSIASVPCECSAW